MEKPKRNPKKFYANRLGYIGETYILYELAKRNIRCQIMDITVADFDLFTEYGERIEVKSSRPVKSWNGAHTHLSMVWTYNNYNLIHLYDKGTKRVQRYPRDRHCDFFIFLGMDKDMNVKKVFVVPKKEVGARQVISEPIERKRKNSRTKLCLTDWQDRWDLIKSGEDKW